MLCPICGGNNHCGKVNNTICWCEQITFPPSVIDHIPTSKREKACVCVKCVEKSKNSSKYS